MSPEERTLLERALKLSQENNKLLKKMQRMARWAFVWGGVKVLIVVVPVVLGFIYLQPFFEAWKDGYQEASKLINSLSR